MRWIALAITFLAVSNAAMAAPDYPIVNVPCEEMLKEVRASRAVDKLTNIEQTRISSLQTMATTRCDAGDYVAADRLLSEAMDIMDE